MQALYSIALSPSEAIICEVREMKEKLSSAIGWFNSKNSLAHITINEFMASDAELDTVKMELMAICDTLQPIAVTFNNFGNYPNSGAFFIAPDTVSAASLKTVMQQINDSLRVNTKFKNNEPHMSIARRLTPEKIAVAQGLFPSVVMKYCCDSVAIRKFDEERKQFDIIAVFKFKNHVGLTI